jgi:glycosyltransferase involved in cell wall biosynthesis
MAKVSVVIPVYNVEKHLNSCIDSLINQTLNEIEIILVNDGSTDNSGTICDDYASKDKRIRVIHKENGGLSDARNTGFEIINGSFICYLDSDDWFEHNMLEDFYNAAIEANADIVVGGIMIDYVHEGYNIEKNLNNMVCKDSLVTKGILECEEKGLFNPVCNKLYRSEFLRNNNITFIKDGMPAEDLLYNCEHFKRVKSLVLLDKAYYHYMRRNEETLVTKYYDNLTGKINRFINARKELYNYYRILENVGERQFNKTKLVYLHLCIKNIYRKECNLTSKDKISLLREIKKDIINIKGFNKIYNDLFSKIINQIISGDNFVLMHIKYTLIFFLRNRLNLTYLKIRRYVFLNNR